MATSSADPDALDGFVSTSQDLNADLSAKVAALADAYQRFQAAPSDVSLGSPSQSNASPPRLEHLGDTVEAAATHRSDREAEANWTAVVSRAFRQAGSGGALPSLDDAVIDRHLLSAGVAVGAPRLMSVEAPSAAGLTVDSGFKDDPVNCGTGAFVQPEVDLPAPRRLWALAWVRNHNSRFPRPGPLGRGWSSWATTRLHMSPTSARFEGPDGQVVEVVRTGDGFATDPNLAADVGEAEGGGELAWWSGERWRFGADGRPCEVVLGPAGSVRFQHDSEGRLRSMAHPAGRRLDVEWEGDRIVAVRASDATGAVHGAVAYQYADGDLIGSEGPAGQRTYEVDGEGRVVAVVDADGVQLARNTYDVDGRVLTQLSPRDLRTAYEYRPGPVTTVADGDQGPKVVMFHDSLGRLTGAVDDHGARLTRRFDEDGNLVGVRDRAGASTGHEFMARGRLVRRVLPGGAEERFAYDGGGRLTTCVGAGGAAVTLEYDSEADVVPRRITDPEGATTVIEADGDHIRRITDADGVSLTFDYDAEGFPVAVTDALGHRRLVERDHGGRVTAVRMPGGQVQRFEFDGAGRPVRRTDADGAVWQAGWSAAGRLTGCTAPDGSRFDWRRDQAGDVASLVDPLGATIGVSTDVLGKVVGISLAGESGAAFGFAYDGLGRLTTVHDPAGGTASYEHDAAGRVTAAVDAVGRRRRFEYDEAGRLVRAVDGEGHVTVLAYDDGGRLAARTLPGGATVVVERDRCGRPVGVRDPNGATTRFEYTPAGRLSRVVSPLGHANRWHYDGAGKVVGRTDPTGATTRYRRNSNGWVTRVEHPDGEVTRLLHDPCGRVVEHHHPDGGVHRFGYDAMGRLVEVTGPTGCRRRRSYDGRGALVEATDPMGGATRYGYDQRGLLTSVTDAAGGTVRYERDAAGRVTAVTDALGRVTRLEHDLSGRPTLLHGPDGRRCQFRFDGEARLVGLVADGTEALLERDPVGRVTRVVDHTGEHRFEWDGAGRLVARHGRAGTLRWRYDSDGRPTTLVYPGGTEAHSEHDGAGRLVALNHPAAGRVEVARDPLGRPLMMRGPGFERAWTWRHHRLVAYQEGDHHVRLERDGAGRVVEVASGGEVTRYGYDVAGRLVAAGDLRWGYDGSGRLASEDGPAGAVRWRYDAGHQLVWVEGGLSPGEVAHDGAGRRLAAGHGSAVGSRRYRWDPFGRLAEVAGTRLEVNVLGELVAVDGEPLAWDTVGPLPQLRQVGERSIVGAGEPWAVVTAGKPEWLTRDWDGSPIGTVADPWGAAAEPGAGLAVGFRGGWTLEGLVWLGQRAYDPGTRSFLSPDPLPGIPGFTTGANPYHYCHHDPVGRVDPLGLQPLSDADWDAWKAAHPTLAEQVGDGVRGAANWVGEHWEVLAAVAVVATGVLLVATGVGVAVGTGILVGAGSTLAVQLMKGGPIDSRSVALSGLVGGTATGVGALATRALASAPIIANSVHSGVVSTVGGGGVGGLTNGLLSEGYAERADTNPFNDDIAWSNVAVEATGGLFFGGVRSTIPPAEQLMSLGIPVGNDAAADGATSLANGLWSEATLSNHGD